MKRSGEWRPEASSIRDLIAFWIFGLSNNFSYVVMLSAAEDIIGRQEHSGSDPSTVNSSREVCEAIITERHCNLMSTGAVLLADIIPALVMKLSLPFFMHRIPFGLRHFVVCTAQALSFIIVALSRSVAMSLTGVAFASFASGLGESCYLSLTTHYSRNTISAWSSGTGGAGIVGAVAYAVATEPHLAHLSPQTTLLAMLIVPALFAVAYWFILTPSPTVHRMELTKVSSWVVSREDLRKRFHSDTTGVEGATRRSATMESMERRDSELSPTFVGKLQLAVPLLKYMVPLTVVFFAEYFVNQGLADLIYFDCSHGLWLSRPSQYRWYQMLYQLGVFISRSSLNCCVLPSILITLLPALQLANMTGFLFDSIYAYMPHITLVFALIFVEGLIGGAAYVNIFDKVHSEVPIQLKEYSLSVVTLADTLGIVISGLVAIPAHNFICSLRAFKMAH